MALKRRCNCSDSVAYLREKTEMEIRMRKEEMEFKKGEMQRKATKQDQLLTQQNSMQDQQNTVIKTMVEHYQQMHALQMMMLQQQNTALMA